MVEFDFIIYKNSNTKFTIYKGLSEQMIRIRPANPNAQDRITIVQDGKLINLQFPASTNAKGYRIDVLAPSIPSGGIALKFEPMNLTPYGDPAVWSVRGAQSQSIYDGASEQPVLVQGPEESLTDSGKSKTPPSIIVRGVGNSFSDVAPIILGSSMLVSDKEVSVTANWPGTSNPSLHGKYLFLKK